MSVSYNRIAGQSVERLAALSDGIFGVGMTLLLLDLHAPQKVRSEGEMRGILVSLLPGAAVYLMSFITLGIFWVGQQTQLNHLKKSDRHLTSNITLRTALLVYWGNILFLGVMLYAGWGAGDAGESGG